MNCNLNGNLEIKSINTIKLLVPLIDILAAVLIATTFIHSNSIVLYSSSCAYGLIPTCMLRDIKPKLEAGQSQS